MDPGRRDAQSGRLYGLGHGPCLGHGHGKRAGSRKGLMLSGLIALVGIGIAGYIMFAPACGGMGNNMESVS